MGLAGQGSGSRAIRVGGHCGSEGVSQRGSLSTHLSREEAEDLRGEGDQALGAGVVRAAGRGQVRARGTRGSPVQPGGQQCHAGLQHRGHQVKKQQEAQQQEVGLGAGAKLACRGRQKSLGFLSESGPGPSSPPSNPQHTTPSDPGIWAPSLPHPLDRSPPRSRTPAPLYPRSSSASTPRALRCARPLASCPWTSEAAEPSGLPWTQSPEPLGPCRGSAWEETESQAGN